MGLVRERIEYSVGNKNNLGDPWGGRSLTIEPDGRARLDQDTLGGVFTWTGIAAASALDRLWAALEEADFPAVADHSTPAGSATRALRIGAGAESRVAYIAYHAVDTMPGYGTAFMLLDTIIRQISQDMVKVAPPSDKIVDGVERLV